MPKYEFKGMSTEQFNPQDREKFWELYNGTLIEKEPLTVWLDDKEVKLHLYIEDVDMSEYDDTEDHVISIGVVPSFDCLSEKNKENILGQFADDERESISKDTIGLLQESMCYGFRIDLRSETVQPDEVEHKIDCAIAVRHAVSGLIGFELDRCVNRIGNTGWDFLSDYCEDADRIKIALDRYENKV